VYFVNWLLNGVNAGKINPTLIPCNEEVWFHFSGHMNSQYKINLPVENHKLIHEVPLHDDNVDVWCAMSATRVIGPIFFWDCKFMLISFTNSDTSFRTFIQLGDKSKVFQQTSATTHCKQWYGLFKRMCLVTK